MTLELVTQRFKIRFKAYLEIHFSKNLYHIDTIQLICLENPLSLYRFLVLCFVFYFIFVEYFILFSLIFLFLYQFFNLFNCFQRHLVVILSSLLVAAISLVMKLRQRLIQLSIQVYKYNFFVIKTLYIKQLTTSIPDKE